MMDSAGRVNTDTVWFLAAHWGRITRYAMETPSVSLDTLFTTATLAFHWARQCDERRQTRREVK